MASAEFTFHPLAEIFPLMDGAEFDALKADIAEHGQQEMIVTWNGTILDGRNRYRACQALGIEPKTIEWSGVGSAQAFVISHNLHRRHLNESQRAMVAARIATRTKEDAWAENAALRHPSSEAQICASEIPTQEKAAKLLNVGERLVTDARRILNEGTAEEITAIDSGKASVTTVSKQIKRKVPPAERAAKMSNPNQDRVHTQRVNGKLWRTFKDALINLTSLPLPSEVARIVRGQDRQNLTDQKLLVALNWLQEFSNEWTSPEFDAKGNSRRKDKPAREAGKAPDAQEAKGRAEDGERNAENGADIHSAVRYWGQDHRARSRDQADDDHAGDGNRPA